MELETLKAFHYPGLTAWEQEAPERRAELIAHERIRAVREAWAQEWMMAHAGEKPADSGGSALDAMKRRMGLMP